MPKLEVLKRKKLVLKNVIRKELKNVQIESLNEEINEFGLLLNKLSVQLFGPLVLKSNGVSISDAGIVTMDYDLFVQAHNYNAYKSAFELIERLEVPNCIFVRFEGNPADVQFAHSKLDLYFYENDLEHTAEVYSVLVEDSEHHSVVDIFRPVRTL